jgi:hypothetical protein
MLTIEDASEKMMGSPEKNLKKTWHRKRPPYLLHNLEKSQTCQKMKLLKKDRKPIEELLKK